MSTEAWRTERKKQCCLIRNSKCAVEKENVPVERIVSLALAQALGAWRSERTITERATRGSREEFLAVLAKAPDVEPEEYDRLPDDLKSAK